MNLGRRGYTPKGPKVEDMGRPPTEKREPVNKHEPPRVVRTITEGVRITGGCLTDDEQIQMFIYVLENNMVSPNKIDTRERLVEEILFHVRAFTSCNHYGLSDDQVGCLETIRNYVQRLDDLEGGKRK